jgi:hypothetical protein
LAQAPSAYGNSAYGNSAYGNSAYGNSAYGNSAYGNSAYGNSAYGVSAHTAPGMAHTTQRARQPIAPVLLLVGALGALLVVGGVVWSGLYFLAMRASLMSAIGQRNNPPAASTHTAKQTDKPNLTIQDHSAASYDRRRIDVDDAFRRAEELAKKALPDAELTSISIENVNRDGLVNMEVTGRHKSSVFFTWRSPEKSKPPPDLPLGASHKAACTFMYSVDTTHVTAGTADHISCMEPTIARPKCTVRKILAAAEAEGAPRGNYIATVYYRLHKTGRPLWYVRIGEFQKQLPDSC